MNDVLYNNPTLRNIMINIVIFPNEYIVDVNAYEVTMNFNRNDT